MWLRGRDDTGPLMCGTVWRQTRGAIKKWKECFLLLSHSCLLCYHNEDDMLDQKAPKLKLELTEIQGTDTQDNLDVYSHKKSRKLCKRFVVVPREGAIWVLKAHDTNEAQEWTFQLREAILICNQRKSVQVELKRASFKRHVEQNLKEKFLVSQPDAELRGIPRLTYLRRVASCDDLDKPSTHDTYLKELVQVLDQKAVSLDNISHCHSVCPVPNPGGDKWAGTLQKDFLIWKDKQKKSHEKSPRNHTHRDTSSHWSSPIHGKKDGSVSSRQLHPISDNEYSVDAKSLNGWQELALDFLSDIQNTSKPHNQGEHSKLGHLKPKKGLGYERTSTHYPNFSGYANIKTHLGVVPEETGSSSESFPDGSVRQKEKHSMRKYHSEQMLQQPEHSLENCQSAENLLNDKSGQTNQLHWKSKSIRSKGKTSRSNDMMGVEYPRFYYGHSKQSGGISAAQDTNQNNTSNFSRASVQYRSFTPTAQEQRQPHFSRNSSTYRSWHSGRDDSSWTPSQARTTVSGYHSTDNSYIQRPGRGHHGVENVQRRQSPPRDYYVQDQELVQHAKPENTPWIQAAKELPNPPPDITESRKNYPPDKPMRSGSVLPSWNHANPTVGKSVHYPSTRPSAPGPSEDRSFCEDTLKSRISSDYFSGDSFSSNNSSFDGNRHRVGYSLSSKMQ